MRTPKRTRKVVKMPESERERWDAQLEESDLREHAAAAWGTDAQLNKAAEEFAELAAAINRDLNGQQDRDEFLRELVDARLMLWQVELLFTERELESGLADALDDLDHRLEVYG